MSTKVLFACSKCFSRHPFEELSSGEQLCKDCRGASLVTVKCGYCRTEFQQSSKSGSTSGVCKRCEANVKQYGKPTACECCSIIAAFLGGKCQRCTNSESKYGPPVQCDQCKQRSAFDRRDESKKIDGKLLCYLCISSFKRAVLKARQVKDDARMAKKRSHPTDKSSSKDASGGVSTAKKSSQRSDLKSKQPSSSSADVPDKGTRQSNNNGGGGVAAVAAVTIDPNSSDHVIAMTELREKIAGLQKRLSMKDREILEKDKQITELKGRNFDNANENRNKLRETERIYDMKVDLLNKKVSSLLREVATLKKGQKKNGTSSSKSSDSTANASPIDQKESSKDSGGSGTNSPITT